MPTALRHTTKCCLLSATDPIDRRLWACSLQDTAHDVYHLHEYAHLDATRNGGRAAAFLFVAGKRSLLLPLVVRETPNFGDQAHSSESTTTFDAISPYGFPGPALSECGIASNMNSANVSFMKEAATSFVELLRSRNIVSVFLRFHPLLAHQVSFAELVMAAGSVTGKVVPHGDSVYCDLSLTEAEMWQQTRRRDRSYINKAQREGFRFEFDQQWSGLEQFIEMYYATMRRVNADSFYFFPREYFHQLRDCLADYAHLAFVKSPDDHRVCGAILTTCSDIIQYHLAGTHGNFRHCHPNKFLIDQARRWGKRIGKRWLHLGGGVGGAADSLLHFKSGFSKLRSTFRSFRLVTDPLAYERIVAQWSPAEARKTIDFDGYFPAYRNPIDGPKFIAAKTEKAA